PLYFLLYTSPVDTIILSLHDALPISCSCLVHVHAPAHLAAHQPTLTVGVGHFHIPQLGVDLLRRGPRLLTGGQVIALGHYQPGVDRKSTRLNSSHVSISYAVFCLQKK